MKIFLIFQNLFNRHSLAVSLLLAFVIRSVAAFSNYGPFAVDDYLNVIEPALRYLIQGAKPEIPSLRFELLPYAFGWFMKPLWLAGVKRADWLVSFAYFIMGLISLLQIVAVHRIGALLLSAKWQNALTFFAATWAIAPIFTDSADIAGPAYLLLTFSLLYTVRARPLHFAADAAKVRSTTTQALLFSGFFLSAAIFFRFSLAPLYFALAVWVVTSAEKEKRLRDLAFFGAGGAITAIAMALLEIATGKLPFSTAIEFIRYNFGAHIETQSYGSMPWHMYIGIVLLFPLPVLNFFFWWPMLKVAKRYTAFSVLFLAFLVSHSAIAFKLERYVIPVIPILMVFLFKGIEDYSDRRWMRACTAALFTINTLLILPVALTMQQRAGVDGAIHAGSLGGLQFAQGIDPWRQAYYGLNRPTPRFVSHVDEMIGIAAAQKAARFTLFRFLYLSEAEQRQLKDAGFDCRLSRAFKPDFLERLSIRLNPAMNGRRNDTSVYSCNAAINLTH